MKEYTKLRSHRKITLIRVLCLLAVSILILSACGEASNPSTSEGDNGGSATIPSGSPSGNKETPSQDKGHEDAQAQTKNERDLVQEQLQQLTLEEKIGQMILAGVQGTTLDDQAKQMIANQKIGGIIFYANNVTTLQGTAAFVQSIKEENQQNPVPILMSVDQEGGKVNRMPDTVESIPSNRIVGKTNDPELAEEMGALLARQIKLAGFNVDFAPVLDINSNPKNPVIGDRSFGTSPDLVTRMGIAEMKGLRNEGVIPVVKHFPGHGDTSVDSHLDLPVVNKSEKQLAELEWIPFQAAVKEQAEAVMVAHILFPELDPKYPASLSDVIIGDHLRGKLKYDGVVITDDLSMGAISKNYPLEEAAVATVHAGSDILLVAHSYESAKTIFDTLISAVKSGEIKESRIDESVYRILSLKQQFKLSDEQQATGDVKRLNTDIRKWRKQVDVR
ncbi:Beta-hexosaminidase [Paenibacillus sp. JJ-100]|uniref:beta-N-acetylhexosaminidase n=1 Tax=Paenibacillus sp. JJ-100 TaxID=2974896 RepID=UPI0022FF9EA1|nr:beta-N-acetylhexosaminidase [Paenibacillus sp. JJ-100]CAI6040124.1 Beta-hexosaminidase [Paenibacillus sp. JJ-100]